MDADNITDISVDYSPRYPHAIFVPICEQPKAVVVPPKKECRHNQEFVAAQPIKVGGRDLAALFGLGLMDPKSPISILNEWVLRDIFGKMKEYDMKAFKAELENCGVEPPVPQAVQKDRHYHWSAADFVGHDPPGLPQMKHFFNQ